MHCWNCGQELHPDSTHCFNCGLPQGEEHLDPHDGSGYDGYGPGDYPPYDFDAGPEKSPLIPILISVAAGLLLIGVAVVLLLSSRACSPDSDDFQISPTTLPIETGDFEGVLTYPTLPIETVVPETLPSEHVFNPPTLPFYTNYPNLPTPTPAPIITIVQETPPPTPPPTPEPTPEPTEIPTEIPTELPTEEP
ncbi:MAG TPA: hypothetical protein GXZ89_02295, partial [Fastidiosipila sp.]|nr:hypothetical protein [Fastidiosipila sp.]